MATPLGQKQPTPEVVFETLNAHQKTAALKAAIELEIFTAIAEGATSASTIARRCRASERGIRTLCDYLTIQNFLTKTAGNYGLSPVSATFLDKRSPAYLGSIAGFLTSPLAIDRYRNLTEVVRKGGALEDDQGTSEADNPMWIEFARSMAAMQFPSGEAIAAMVKADAGEKWKVLDIAAGHGVFGIAIAKHNPNSQIYAADWPAVLAVAMENAKNANVANRFHTIPGSAFDVDFGSGYDLVLLTNFLHHFDAPTNEKLLRKIHAAMNPKGQLVTLEFVPNEDRVSPPIPAQFSLTMLAGTRAGDAYTFAEFDQMLNNTGFSSNKLLPMPLGPQSVIISQK